MAEKKSYYKKKGEFKPKVEYKHKRGNTDGSGLMVHGHIWFVINGSGFMIHG